MGKKSDTITCIYCKKEKRSSKEHAVQRSLGGNLTIPLVCMDCNTGFSKIDRSLAEKSLLSMIRVVEQSTDAQTIDLAGTHFWTPPGEETIEVKVGYRMGAKPKPQLMFENVDAKTNIRSCAESAQDFQLLIQVIRDWIKKGTIDSIPILDSPVNQPNYTLPRLVLHKNKDLFFRAPENFPNQKDFFRKITEFLKKSIDSIDENLKKSLVEAPTQSVATPQIVITSSICLNDVYRAVAKIAFNILAAKEGADFVLQESFDEIRNYIIGTDIRNKKVQSTDEVEYDNRFVHMIPAGQETPFPRAGQNNHTCLLMYVHPELFAGIDFYGQQYYMVQLANLKLDRHIMHVHGFNYVDKTNHSLTLEEIAQNLQEQMLIPRNQEQDS